MTLAISQPTSRGRRRLDHQDPLPAPFAREPRDPAGLAASARWLRNDGEDFERKVPRAQQLGRNRVRADDDEGRRNPSRGELHRLA
jgi:hypothetical protein